MYRLPVMLFAATLTLTLENTHARKLCTTFGRTGFRADRCLWGISTISSRPSPLNQANFSTAQLVRNSRYQQLAEGIERTDRRELERHQMGLAERQLLQHGVRCQSVRHIQDEDDIPAGLPTNTIGRSCHRGRAARS